MDFTKEQLKGIAIAYLIEKRELENQVEKLRDEIENLSFEFDEYRNNHSCSSTTIKEEK